MGYPESARAAPAPPGGTACRQRTVNGRMLRATHLGRAVSPSSHPCVRPASQLPTVRVTLSAVPPRGVHCCLFSVSSMSPSSVCCQGSGGGIQALVHTGKPGRPLQRLPRLLPSRLPSCAPPLHTHHSPNSLTHQLLQQHRAPGLNLPRLLQGLKQEAPGQRQGWWQRGDRSQGNGLLSCPECTVPQQQLEGWQRTDRFETRATPASLLSTPRAGSQDHSPSSFRRLWAES